MLGNPRRLEQTGAMTTYAEEQKRVWFVWLTIMISADAIMLILGLKQSIWPIFTFVSGALTVLTHQQWKRIP
jgi:hypothetical protein